MEKDICDQVAMSWKIAEEDAEKELHIYDGADISQLKTLITECRKNYKNSGFGYSYFEYQFPKLSDKQMLKSVAIFYCIRYCAPRRINNKIEDWEAVLDEIGGDAELFFRNYFLERKLKKLVSGEAGVQLHPKVNDNQCLLDFFKGNKKSLSFFLYRCDGKENNKLVKEVQAVMEAGIVKFKNTEDDRTRYKLMYDYLKELGYDVKSESAWNQCMNNPHKSIVPIIAQIYKDNCKV